MTHQQPNPAAIDSGPLAELLTAALDLDDERLAATLAPLDRDQLHQVFAAATAVGIATMRALDDDQAAVDGWDVAYWRNRAHHFERNAEAAGSAYAREQDRAAAAERRAQCRERERDEEAANALRFANYLMAAQVECSAPNWPALAETVKTLRKRAERAETARDTERRRAESSENQDADHMRWLSDARDAADAEDWPSIPAAVRALRTRAEKAERARDEQPAPAAVKTADLRHLIEQNPQILRNFLRDEIRRDPEWWRRTLRAEARAGHLTAVDFHRAGLA